MVKLHTYEEEEEEEEEEILFCWTNKDADKSLARHSNT